MNIQVTSVSKKEQKTSEAAGAVFVISREDILRSGSLTIPDLLRMVPGLDVAQIDAGKWAISARGFNGQYSNKLLVLIDGRTVYTSLYGGVFWDSQNIALVNVDRIEVIRGPGAAVWGANAVNGVINIITRSAADTQGGYVAVTAGNSNIGPDIIGYGGNAGKLGAYRVYGEGFQFKSLPISAGLPSQNDWHLTRVGFRTDATLSVKDAFTTEGELYRGNAGEMATEPVSLLPPATATVPLRDRYSGWNLLTRWNHTISTRSDTSLQVYVDRTSRGDSTYAVSMNTADIEFQNRVAAGAHHDIVWGLGYRVTADHTSPTLRIVFTPQNRLTQLFTSFAQDEIVIIPDRLHFSAGARLEHNDYTGFNFQPSARVVWTPNQKNMVWSAVSMADRTPARSDTDIRVNLEAFPAPGGTAILVSLFGDPNKKNERLTAFEVGYRNALTSTLSVDSTMFYNRYRDLMSVEPMAMHLESTPLPPHLVVPNTFGDGLQGETHGIEIFAHWKPESFWTVSPGYAFLSIHIHPFGGSQDLAGASGTEHGTPNHQAQLRSSVSLPWKLQWNASAYFVNRLSEPSIASYTRLDTGLVWHAGEQVSLSVVGQNLLRDHHAEYAGPNSSVQSEWFGRSAYGKIVWAF